MEPRKKICRCPPVISKICRGTKKNPKDVQDIIAALEYEAEIKNMKKQPRGAPKLKKYKPLRVKENYVPMYPPMELRLRFIGHCDPEPYKRKFERKPKPKLSLHAGMLDFGSTDGGSSKKNKVRYADQTACTIRLDKPVPFVKHTDSNTSIFNIPSPKMSGENIAPQKATVKPGECRPPLPGKSAIDIYKPHSGIVINQDMDFVPDVVLVGQTGKLPKKPRKGRHRAYRCPKGGLCMNKNCKRKRCRKLAAMRMKQRKRVAARRGSQLDSNCWSEFGYTGDKPKKKKSVPGEEDDCGLDDFTQPEHAQIPEGLKRGVFKTHSLTVVPCKKEKKGEIHYGILMGQFNMYSDKFGSRSRGRQALAMSVMSYCLAFHYHPKQWSMKLIDHLVEAGDQWYLQLADKVHDHSAYQGMCEVLPFGKKQVLLLNGKKMQVLLCEPDVVGYTMSLDPTVYNLCRGLKAFFHCHRAGVLMTRILKVMIWKDNICYYIFDPAGRNAKAYSNYSSGTAALINVNTLEAVADILLTRSVVEDQKFVLAPVKVLKMIDEKCEEDIESDRELTQAEKSSMSYRILNENTAIVNANMHLGDRCFEESRFKQALPIAIAAMTYAKISPPNTWFSKTLDKIMRLGNKLYQDCMYPKVVIDITVDNIPNEIMIGPYACEIIIYRDRTKGQLFTTKECILNIANGLEDFFNHNYNAGIIDFNNYKIAVWRQKDMFYLFDPYPRTTDGLRSMKTGKGCCLMLLNIETMAEAFTKNWDFLPATTQYFIHAFKVLKLRKRLPKTQIKCTLSDDKLPGVSLKRARAVLKAEPAGGGGAGGEPGTRPASATATAMNIQVIADKSKKMIDEEYMGEIISLVDSIQEDYIPPIAPKYKNLPPEPVEPRVVNLDSPTVSVTQVVPPWPKPRDKTNEPPEPDPDYEPTPPPTPPPPPPPEGGVEEEEADEEELDEEALKAKKEEEKRRKAEEEEARRKAEELPPPMPPPPPSPQLSTEEMPLCADPAEGGDDGEFEMPTMEPVQVERYVLLTEDAKRRFKLRQIRKKMTLPLTEDMDGTAEEELMKPHNFHDLPDTTQIIRGTQAIPEKESVNILPFTAIMAIVTSYKYSINSWTPGIVDFVIDASKKLYANKKEKFQLSPLHIIPKIGIGHQAFQANIDVVGEGATWQMEDVLTRKFFPKNDRGMITTSNYSCAVFRRGGLYYLFDGSTCNGMGIRDVKDSKGKACFLRFRSLHDLCCRVLYNKDGIREDQQFILSRILVRRLLPEPRYRLPEDYDYEAGKPRSSRSKPTLVEEKPADAAVRAAIEDVKEADECQRGYRSFDGIYRIEGTTALKRDGSKLGDVKPCHFVCLVAMLMATMHPLRDWNQIMVDTCIEKGLEIHDKATNFSACEKRVVKNIILDGKFMNVNIKKIIVINENETKTLEQYMRAVLSRLRYVIVRFPTSSLVICQTDGFYHLFDPYPSPQEDPTEIADLDNKSEAGSTTDDSKTSKKKKEVKIKKEKKKKPVDPVAGWTLYRSLDSLMNRIRKTIPSGVNSPEFYTFELTSVRQAPCYSALNYKLSPLFKPEQNPNYPYMRQRRPRPLVDEKMYWLNVECVPWSRMNATNDVGLPRNTPRTMWKDWHIEFPGDLYSLWGSVSPRDARFGDSRGQQYLACCVVADVMTHACDFAAWTGSFLDGIVLTGDAFHRTVLKKLGSKKNHELSLEDFDGVAEDVFPYSFSAKFTNVIFGFVYNLNQDRFNLSKALALFFEKHALGILTSPGKNLAFGKVAASYFMYDCQTFGAPAYCPDRGGSYVLKCESLNRLIYCMTLTLNIKSHNQQFHLYSVAVTLSEKAAPPKKPAASTSKTDDSASKSDALESTQASPKSK